MNKTKVITVIVSCVLLIFVLFSGVGFTKTNPSSTKKKVEASSIQKVEASSIQKEKEEKQIETKKESLLEKDKSSVLKADPELLQLLKNAPSQKDFPKSNAVILTDETTLKFNENSTFSNTEHRIIKILTQQGLQRFGELRIPYSNASQKVNLELLRIVRSDGRLIPVPKDAVQELSPPTAGSTNAFSHLRVLFIQFPGVDINGLIEYKITIDDKSGLRSLLGYEVYMQDTEPIIDGKVSVWAPKGKTLYYQGINLGKITPTTTEDGNGQNFLWAFKNVSPFFTEPSMPAAKDYVGRLVVGLNNSWDNVSAETQKIIASKGYSGKEKELEAMLKEVTKDAKDIDDKIRKVYAYVTGSIKTLPIEFGRIGYTPQEASTILKDKVGDGKDKAALLIGMLKNIGVEALPVLVSTNMNGKLVKDIVALSQFNHILVWIPSKQLWLDPSSETASYGYIPPESQGVEGLVLSDKKGSFVTTPTSEARANKEEIICKSKLLPDATLEAEIVLKEHGANNLLFRRFLNGVKPQERIMVLESLANQITPRFKVTSSYLSPLEDLNNPLEMKVAFHGKNYAMPAGDLLILTIPLISTSRLDEQVKTVSAERKYPFVLGQLLHEEKVVELLIPQGYRLRAVPKGDEVNNNVGTYKAAFTTTEGKLTFKSSFIINKKLVSIEEFGSLRKLIDAHLQIEEEKIVLEKIK